MGAPIRSALLAGELEQAPALSSEAIASIQDEQPDPSSLQARIAICAEGSHLLPYLSKIRRMKESAAQSSAETSDRLKGVRGKASQLLERFAGRTFDDVVESGGIESEDEPEPQVATAKKTSAKALQKKSNATKETVDLDSDSDREWAYYARRARPFGRTLLTS